MSRCRVERIFATSEITVVTTVLSARSLKPVLRKSLSNCQIRHVEYGRIGIEGRVDILQQRTKVRVVVLPQERGSALSKWGWLRFGERGMSIP